MFADDKDYTILIIEDNIGDYTLIEEYLKETMQYSQIHHAERFTNAINLVQSYTFDIILLDLTLPDKSGIILIKEMLSVAADVPVIILTGLSDIEFSKQSLSLGIADYLLKDEINAFSLYKSIIYSLERKKITTQLVESRNTYNRIFRLSPQPMMIVDLENLKFTEVNNAAIEHYGYTRDEFLEMTIYDIRKPEDVPEAQKFINEYTDKNQNKSLNTKHVKKNGDIIDTIIYTSPITINNKQFRLVISHDITEEKELENKITKAIIKTQEDERYDIGGELHDNVCQILAASQMSLRMLEDNITPEDKKWYHRTVESITLATEEIRNLSHRLAPAIFGDISVQESLLILLDSINIEEQYNIELNINPAVKELNLCRDVQLNLYRTLQEQLRNISKYAKAKNLKIHLGIDKTFLTLYIADDGIGFDTNITSKGIGFANMRRRAELYNGKLYVDSSPGKGCSVWLKLPLSELRPEDSQISTSS